MTFRVLNIDLYVKVNPITPLSCIVDLYLVISVVNSDNIHML